VRSPIYLRRRHRETASSTSSATLIHEQLSESLMMESDGEPVCRRTRSAKRRSNDYSANESDEENEIISKRVLNEL